MNTLLFLVLLLVAVGIILYIVPIDEAIKTIIYKVLVVIVCVTLLIWVLGVFGIAVPRFK